MTDAGLAWPGFVPPVRLPDVQLDALRAAYADPPRAYHHFGHVVAVARHYAEVAVGPGWRRPAEVWWALLYHDAIYLPGRSDNETRSAELARAHHACWGVHPAEDTADGLSPDADAFDIGRVAELIAWTARHGGLRLDTMPDGPGRDDLLHFLDCDMAILAAPPAEFDAYDRAIAEEYRAVPRWIYRRRRRQFFRQLLALDRIYLSTFFHERLEADARRNLLQALG